MKKIALLIVLFFFSGFARAQTEKSGVKTESANQLNEDDGDEQIFTVVEEQPEFEGGLDSMKVFINSNANKRIRKKYLGEGTVYIQFIVQKDGSITDPKIIRGIAPDFDAEVIRLVSQMPKWRPGKQAGKVKKVRYVLPVRFKD